MYELVISWWFWAAVFFVAALGIALRAARRYPDWDMREAMITFFWLGAMVSAAVFHALVALVGTG